MNTPTIFQLYRLVLELKEIVKMYYPSKISTFDYFVLQQVVECGGSGCTQYELSKAMLVSPARVSPAIKKLLNDKMVELSIDNSTSRLKKIVKPTTMAFEVTRQIKHKADEVIAFSNHPQSEYYEDYLKFKDYSEYLYNKLEDFQSNK
jgi:DNA-binding MarR family transcriptional regulator